MKAMVFDWETTGIPKHPNAKIELQPRAIEFGGVIIDDKGEIIQELSYIIDPEREIEPIITKITGLTNEDLRGKPKFAQVYPALRTAFESCDAMFAHNLPFDRDILSIELQILGIKDFPWPRHGVCTVQTFQEEYGRRIKLTELFEDVMGRKLAQTHRAMDDCRALAEIVMTENLMAMLL